MIEPKPYPRKEHARPLAVIDFETDPFKSGRIPKPFACGFKRADTYLEFWGDDCAEQLVAYLRTIEAHTIYAHNGGNFDFHFLLPYLDPGQTPHIINGRLVRLEIAGHEMRDSWAIMPFPLKTGGGKLEINYDKMERECRDEHRTEIMQYLRADCEALYRLVTGFADLFGDSLTIGSVALPMLRSFHGFETISEQADRQLRPFFRGGRVQCFKRGLIRAPFQVFDVNSMYPSVMRDFEHPVSAEWHFARQIGPRTTFAFIRAKSSGALPWTDDDGVTRYDERTGDFYASIHEIRAGQQTGTLRILKTHWTIEHKQRAKFDEFVTHFYELRQKAKRENDTDADIFYKLVLNSAYGKFALDVKRFANFAVTELTETPKGTEWQPETHVGNLIIWKRPNPRHTGYVNVATAASITGAARAQLWRGICAASGVAYCDTDSIICEKFQGEIDPSKLGAWKLEKTGDALAVAGKKLYALFDGPKTVKLASKGARLSGEDIVKVAQGETVTWTSTAPKFKLNGEHIFVTREITATGNDTETDTGHDDLAE